MGSFLHGQIVAQIMGFYFIAFLFITLGYGHMKRKPWTIKLSKSCIWFWILSLLFFGIMTISSVLTVTNYTFQDIVQLPGFPELEQELLTGLPLKSYYLLIPVLGVLFITIILIVKTKPEEIRVRSLLNPF